MDIKILIKYSIFTAIVASIKVISILSLLFIFYASIGRKLLSIDQEELQEKDEVSFRIWKCWKNYAVKSDLVITYFLNDTFLDDGWNCSKPNRTHEPDKRQLYPASHYTISDPFTRQKVILRA